MQFGVLGPLEVVEGDHRYTLGGPKQRAVLALLIAQAGKPVLVDTLIDSLYGDEASDRAHRSIHTFVSNLRSELGDIIERRGEGYILLTDRTAIDAYRFEDELEAARSLDDPTRIAETLRAALSMWRGHPYADIDVYTTLAAEATRLNELRVEATELRIDSELESGRHAGLIAELEALTVEYPLREHFWAQQMIALYRSGRQAEALRAYTRARSTLIDQTGLDPSAELRQLEERILEQDPDLHFEPRSSIRRAAILVVDVAEPATLATMSPIDRDILIEQQTSAFTGAVAHNKGNVFAHRGSAMYAVFDDVPQATSAAAATQTVLMGQAAPMRMALAAGDVEAQPGSEFVGPPLNRAAALVGAAHGGQILLSSEAHQALTEAGTAGWVIRSLGTHSFSGMDEPLMVQQLVVAGLPSEFPPLQMAALPPSLPGVAKGLPGYELREKIGSGVFGVVHRAYQPSVGREVAVKVIRPEFANHPDFIRRFEVEAQLVARLEHPHIVPLHDYWRDADGAFLVMRWVRGGSVADWLQRGPLELFEVNTILAQIIPALDHAHRNGVLHRDLKPSNVLLDDDGNAYLTDFGIAVDAPRDDPTAGFVDMRGIGSLVERCLAGAELSPAIEEFFAQVKSDSFADLVSLLDAWAVASGAEGLASDEIGFTPTRNPYKGLSAFGESDAADFHGREDETHQLLDAIDQRKLVAVVGPSGIGKSSVVRAGLIPALRAGALPDSESWLITDMMPGTHPFEALATALHRVAIEPGVDIEQELRRDERGLIRAVSRTTPDGLHLVIVIDQFEELFTLTEDESVRRQFLDVLMAAIADPRAGVSLVLTLRADFFDRPLRFGRFGDELRRATVPIASPTEDDLRAIIIKPAEALGISVDSALVERMVVDVKDQPGALPLLEFSLTEMFAQRESDQLLVGAYESAGGVRGALGRRAEAIFLELDRSTKEVARQVFLRLVTLPDAERVTRRRVRQTEFRRLGETPAAIDTVLGAFGERRLLVTDMDPVTHGPTVEVAHEAIFAGWDRLGRWIAERRSDLRARRRLLESANDWEESGRQEALLLSGARLAQLESWAQSTDLSIGDSERELIVESLARRDRDAAGRRRTRRRVLAGFASAAVVATVFALVAGLQRNDAEQARDTATSRELAAKSIAQLEIDPEQSVLLALESVAVGQTADTHLLESTAALRRALASHRIVHRFDGGAFVAVSPDGELIATGTADGAAIVRELDSGEVVAELPRPGTPAIGAAFSPNGLQIAVAYASIETPLWIWDLDGDISLQLEGPDMTGDGAPVLVSFDDSGEFVATGALSGVGVWSALSGELILSTGVAGDSEFVPGTSQLLVADSDNQALQIFDISADLPVDEFPVPIQPQTLAVSPDGQLVIITSQQDLTVGAWEVASGTEVWRATVDRPFGAVWLSDGDRVAVGSDGGRVTLIDGRTGDIVDVLSGGHVGIVWALATVPDQGLLATSGESDGTTIVWNVEPGPIAEIARLDTGARQARLVDYAPFPDQVFVSDLGTPKTARIIDTATLETVIDVVDPVVGVSGRETRVVGDGSFLATITADGASTLRDVRTKEVLYAVPGMLVRAASYDGKLALVESAGAGDTPPGRPQIVDIATGAPVVTINLPKLGLPWFSYDGSWILDWRTEAANLYSTMDLYSTTNGESVLSIPDVMSVRPMPDGKTISIIDTDGTLWHANLNELLNGETLDNAALWSAFATQGFVSPLGHVANADGSLVVTTARRDEPVKIWDADSGLQVDQLDPELTNGVPHVFFHPDEPYVTLLSEGGILLTYTLDIDELIDIAKGRLTRSLTDAECQTFLHMDKCPDGN